MTDKNYAIFRSNYENHISKKLEVGKEEFDEYFEIGEIDNFPKKFIVK